MHLLHDVAALNLHGMLDRSELRGDLLVEQSGNHQRHHFALARRKQFIMLAQFGGFSALVSRGAVTLNRLPNRIQQSLIAKRLGEKLDGSGFHRLGSNALVGKGRDEDERHKVTLAAYDRHKLRAAHNRHLHIRNQAGCTVQTIELQELLGSLEGLLGAPLDLVEEAPIGRDSLAVELVDDLVVGDVVATIDCGPVN